MVERHRWEASALADDACAVHWCMAAAGTARHLVDDIHGDGDGRSSRACRVRFGYLILTSCT